MNSNNSRVRPQSKQRSVDWEHIFKGGINLEQKGKKRQNNTQQKVKESPEIRRVVTYLVDGRY